MIALAQGFLAAGQGAAGQAVIWTSPDGVTWQRMTAAPLGLTARGRALASVSWATSGQNATVISGQFPGGQWGTWLSTDGGSAWTPVTVPVTGGAEDTISGLAADGSGLIAVRPGRADDAIAYFSTERADLAVCRHPRRGGRLPPGRACEAYVFHSANLASWTQAHDVTGTSGSSQVLAVTADGTGFVSAGSHNGQPAVWTTANGTTWTTIVLPLPASATGVLQQIAVNGSQVVATGVQTSAGATSPLAAVSANGGATFTPVPFGVPGPDLATTALTADTSGFTAAIQSGTPGQQAVTAWTSATGTSWTPSPVSGLPADGSDQLTALAPAGTRLTAITTAATMLSQQPAVLTLPAR